MNSPSANLPWSEQFRIVAKAWVDASGAAELMEETKSAVLSQMMLKQGDIPVSRAEMIVKASDEWVDFITSMVEARKKANLLSVKKQYLQMKFQEWNSHEATKRTEARL